MKAYFTASLTAKNQYLSSYKGIIEYLKKKGITVTSDHILDATEQHIRQSTREERLAFHAKLEQWIKSCDFMIAEASFPSISVGYEISMALHFQKPVLILYSEGDPPSLLGHHHDQKLVCEKYTDGTYGEIIDSFISYIHGKNDIRFTFFITPHIASYLEDVSKSEKMPKSVFLRKLIERHMKSRLTDKPSDAK